MIVPYSDETVNRVISIVHPNNSNSAEALYRLIHEGRFHDRRICMERSDKMLDVQYRGRDAKIEVSLTDYLSELNGKQVPLAGETETSAAARA